MKEGGYVQVLERAAKGRASAVGEEHDGVDAPVVNHPKRFQVVVEGMANEDCV